MYHFDLDTTVIHGGFIFAKTSPCAFVSGLSFYFKPLIDGCAKEMNVLCD